MVDLDCRPSANRIRILFLGERDRPPLRRCGENSAPELGLSRLLRLLLPGPAAGHGHGSAARFGQQSEFYFLSSAAASATSNGNLASPSHFAAGTSAPIIIETSAENWLDHNNIGESNLFWPITWQYALIQGWELTLRSPNLWHRSQFHLAYANQIAQATSPITGGLICPTPVTSACGLDIPPGLSPVDHDQRNTLNVGLNTNLPWHAYASTNVYYGSGFTNGLTRPAVSRRLSAGPHYG